MSRFGWAYVNNAITGAVANGPTKSIQFNSGSQILSGSSSFTFDPSTNVVSLTGTLQANTITGSTITASSFIGNGSLLTNIQGNNVRPVGDTWTIQFENSDGTLTGSSNLQFSSSNLLQISNAGIVFPNTIQNINFTASSTDYIVFASGSALTGTLPSSVSGRIIKIYNYGANNVYITGSGVSGFIGPTGNNIPDFILTTNPRSRDFLFFTNLNRWLII